MFSPRSVLLWIYAIHSSLFLYVAIAAFNLLFQLRYSLNIENKWTKFKDLPFLVQNTMKISPEPLLMKPNEEKCLLSSQPTLLTFSLWLARKMREAAGSRVFPAVFELFSCATSRSSDNIFIKKIHIGKKEESKLSFNR